MTRNQIIKETGKLIDALKLKEDSYRDRPDYWALIGKCERLCNDLTYAGRYLKYTQVTARRALLALQIQASRWDCYQFKRRPSKKTEERVSVYIY